MHSSALGIALRTLTRWVVLSGQRKALRALSQEDRLLNDIGLTREQALREATKPFWDDRGKYSLEDLPCTTHCPRKQPPLIAMRGPLCRYDPSGGCCEPSMTHCRQLMRRAAKTSNCDQRA
jgi:uncharacterized protein YjiS (DUF1127 family)